YGDLFVGALRDQKIVRLDISGEEIVDSETLFEGAFGRIRDVRSGPDGNLWFVTDEPDGGVYTVTPL
ncbi:MAG: PQQ-dependent sugar dehydrogenase, partial [Pseudomonadota bacterium]